MAQPACTTEQDLVRVSRTQFSLKRQTHLSLFTRSGHHHRKSQPAPGAEQLRAGRMYSRPASYPCATFETALCDGSGCLACGRKRLRLQAPDAAAPTTGPCPGSTGSERRACDVQLHRLLVHARPSVSTDERRARPGGTVRGMLQAPGAPCP